MKMSVPVWSRRVERGGIATLLQGKGLQPASWTVSPWDGEAQSLLQVMWWDNSLQQIQARPRVTA